MSLCILLFIDLITYTRNLITCIKKSMKLNQSGFSYNFTYKNISLIFVYGSPTIHLYMHACIYVFMSVLRMLFSMSYQVHLRGNKGFSVLTKLLLFS